MILVTGYKGFIGNFLYKKLIENGYEASGFDLGDNLDLTGIKTVIHLGAISSTTDRDVEKVLNHNYDFSKKLLDECIGRKINFQYASSASVYGRNNVFSEDAPVDPLTPYAWSKYLFERYAKKNYNKNIFVQGFRYFNVWSLTGEDHKLKQSSPYFKFNKDATEKGSVTIFEDSEKYKRDFIHVSDVVKYHIKFLFIKESGLWNIGSGEPKSFYEVANEICKKHNAKIITIPMPKELKDSYQYFTCADMTKMKETLKKYNFIG